MSSEWPLKRLSEVADFHNHRRVPLKSLDRQKRQGKYPYYGASGVVDHIDDYIFDGVFLLVSEDGENLRTRKTPIAFKTSGKFWINNHAHILQEKEEGVLDYLEYYFSILDLTPFITGAVQPKLNKANLETIEIPVPPKDERLKINQVLNSFTNKIELNTQINQTLEQIAQALFKSWFVDFDPVKAKIAVLEAGGTAEAAELAAMGTIAAKSPEQLADMQQSQPEAYQQLTQTAALFPAAMEDSKLGEIPEGWRVSTLKNLSEKISKGTTPRKADLVSANDPAIIPFVKVKDISNGNQIDKGNLEKIPASIHNRSLRRSILAVDDILFSIAGTIGRTYLVDSGLGNSNINQALAFIRLVNKENFLALVYLTLKSNHVQAEIKSKIVQGVQANASLTNISDIKILCPSNDILDSWNGLMSPIINDIRLILELNRKLSVIRDTLLPKLLSGAIDLAHINKSSPSNL